MNIEEIVPEKPINIRSFKFSCDNSDHEIPHPLPNTYNHFMLITAKPKQGKTTLIYNLLTKQRKASPYYGKFDRIYIFSPSMKTIDDDPFEDIGEEQKHSELTIENLSQVYDDIEDSGERVLMICDDCVMDIARNPPLAKLLSKMMMNRRHICGKSDDDGGAGLSMWLTSQVYNKVPRALRATASHHIIFKTTNKKEIQTIYDELILLDRDNFRKLFDYVFDTRFNFLFVVTDAEQSKMYCKNFNQLKLKFDRLI